MKTLLVLVCTVSSALFAQQSPSPILDMHLHASDLADFERLLGPTPIPHCVPMTDYAIPDARRPWLQIFTGRNPDCRATLSPRSNQADLERTLEIMRRRNVIGVVSGPLVKVWQEAAPDRFIPSREFDGPESGSVETLRHEFESGAFKVLGEMAPQYGGVTPDDPSLAPYWKLAEDLDIAVGIHIGTGPVGAPYLPAFPRYRARLHSALVLEEVLVRHPRLRIYIMHAGWPMIDDLLAVLWTHPQVHVDVGVISWALPRREFHRYLQRIVEAGFGKRVMFGSDQMVWPETLEMALESIESADFLTPAQKRDILFSNAARFLRLSDQQVAAMHGRK